MAGVQEPHESVGEGVDHDMGWGPLWSPARWDRCIPQDLMNMVNKDAGDHEGPHPTSSSTHAPTDYPILEITGDQPMPKTMFEKIWDAHIVRDVPGESAVLYIDRHLVHEVTSPQAFASLKASGRAVRKPEATLAVLDHNIPTTQRRRMLDVVDPALRETITTLE